MAYLRAAPAGAVEEAAQPVLRSHAEGFEGMPELLVIRGHKHWDRPLAVLPGGTQVLNVDARAVVLTSHRANAR